MRIEKIDKKLNRSRSKYPFKDIGIGFSLVIENPEPSEIKSIRVRLAQYKLYNPTQRFQTRVVEGNLYINRIS